MALINLPALMRLNESRLLQEFNGRDLAWLLIGAALALVAFWAISRRRRRWL